MNLLFFALLHLSPVNGDYIQISSERMDPEESTNGVRWSFHDERLDTYTADGQGHYTGVFYTDPNNGIYNGSKYVTSRLKLRAADSATDVDIVEFYAFGNLLFLKLTSLRIQGGAFREGDWICVRRVMELSEFDPGIERATLIQSIERKRWKRGTLEQLRLIDGILENMAVK